LATYLALLRGVNLAGVNKVSMAELRRLFEDLGHIRVRTYIQSGNVVFDAPRTAPKKLAREIEQGVSQTFGHEISAIIRTRPELDRVTASNPFALEGVPPLSLHVMFLAASASSSGIKELDPDRSPPDQFEVRGREIYLLYPNGMGRSKLTIDYFEKRLGTRATARNWKTITKLLELMSDR
jgi:uncharacterized protein (DUF1697 family)